MRKLFGTDGIRGVAGESPLDKRTVYAIGRALGDHLPSGPRRIVIGQDTRQSSPWIADVLSAGLRDSGVQIESAGVIPTPGVAYLTRAQGFSAGVVALDVAHRRSAVLQRQRPGHQRAAGAPAPRA